MAKPDLSADDIVKIGLANGFSEPAIKELLSRRGFTNQAINEALSKQTPAAKKVEVTEEFAPGYNRVLNNMFGKDGIVAKSRKRGVSKEDTINNAINYLRGTKVYENATDVQREAMERNVNKEFNKREKSAPSAKKVLGQKKDVVTIEVDLAKERDRLINEQIKAAKSGAKSVSDAIKAITKYFNYNKYRGNLTRSDLNKILNIKN
jgi:hypothetical protein